MNAHTYQVFGSPSLSVVINGIPVGHFHENDVSNMTLLIENLKDSGHVMLFSTLDRDIKVTSNDHYVGILSSFNGLLTLQCAEDTSLNFVFSDSQKLKDIETVVADIFHCTDINPSFGALPLKRLEKELLARTPDYSKSLLNCVLQSSEMFHCYEGKDRAPWVVLHSHCKRLTIPMGHLDDYCQLIKYLTGELLERSEVALSDLYRKIYTENIFSSLLSSNFTVLKKLLIRFNADFQWFQDDSSKTTKVVIQDRLPLIACA